jgi:AraC family transcriptional regulator, exoenzyme S synthesis regulatory protein ExsA
MILEQAEIKYQGKVVFEKLVMSAKFKRLPKLFMEDEACFLFLTKGEFHFRTPTDLLTFSEGDAMLAQCGNYFIENPNQGQCVENQVVSVIGAFFYPVMVKRFFETDLSIKDFKNQSSVVKISVEPLMKSFIESINYMLDNPSIADENLIITKLKELLLLLSKSGQASSINTFVNALFEPQQYNFNEIINRNIYSNLSLNELAYLCNVSLATFKRKFEGFYQESPAKYILRKKLENACNLLSLKSKSISEIAYECGFESISNFDKAFKKVFQQTPSDYRLSQIDK